MKPIRLLTSLALASIASLPIVAQDSGFNPPRANSAKSPPRAEAYYNFTLGHMFELQFEQTNQSEFATRAIEAYKKAYAVDPQSPIIGERLAEMYWKAQRVRDAVAEANEILKRDPNDLPTHRLLGRIYSRSMGDINNGSAAQSETVTKAITQFSEVHRLDPADQESALWLARLYRLHNDSEKAEQILRAMLKDDPDNDAAAEQLTQLLLDSNKAEEAITLLQGMATHSQSATTYDLLGDAYTQTHDYSKAEIAYRKAVDLDPSELGHLRGLGQTLLSEEKYPEALSVYQKLSDLMPDDADVYLRIAQIYRELHQLDKAEENLVKARQYAPGSLEVMYNEAMIYESQGRFEDAIRVLSDAVTGVKSQSNVLPTRRRSLAILYQQLGQLYKDTQNYQAAIYTFLELGHLGEEDRRARLLIMETYRAAKDLPKALQTGREAIAKYPSDQAIRLSLAMLLGENQQADEAIKLLQVNLKGSSSDREVYLNISQIYERSHRYPDAEAAAKKAEALPGEPRENESAWFLLGAIYERQKQFDKAEQQFKKVLDVNPKNAQVLNYYGYMLADRNQRLDEAQDMIQRALDQEPFNGAFLDSLGWVYYKENKLESAELSLRKAVEREPHDPTIRGHLGDILAKQGHMDQAAVEWEKSLTEWRRSLPADMESDKVAEMEKKLGQVKHRVAQKAAAAPDNKQP